jgi:hypothetical protein
MLAADLAIRQENAYRRPAYHLINSDAILVECKWTSKPVGTDILVDLEGKSNLVRPELENRQIRFALCSRSGFTSRLIEGTKQRQDVMLLNLPEIVG